MRIAVVAEWLDPARGGAETSTLQFMSRLVSRGVSLDVFTRSPLPSSPAMTVHSIATSAPGRAAATTEFISKVESAIVPADCDLVHAFIPCVGADVYQPRGGTVAETIQRTIAARRTPLGRAVKRSTLWFNARQRLVLSKEREFLTGDNLPTVIAISEYVARQLREHYAYPEFRIHHAANGVDAKPGSPSERLADRARIRSAWGVARDELLLLQVCHNFRLKGVHCFLEALALARQGGGGCPMKAMVVGRDKPGPWRRLARRLGVDDIVRFTGPTDSVSAFFHAADVMIHPTYYDPCSRVVLEATAHGLPVVCTRYDGASEVLVDGVSGFILDSPDAIAVFADRIRMLGDKTVRQRISGVARSLAERITMDRHAEDVVGIYECLLEGRSRGSDLSTPSHKDEVCR